MTHPCQPMVALIPARAGSKRIPGKNMKLLAGQPLLRYTLEAVKAAGVFADIIVSSEDAATLRYAAAYGARAMWCPTSIAHRDETPDIYWVRYTLDRLRDRGARPASFALLRVTAPFRTAATIQRAYQQFTRPDQTADTLRAVELATQHPAKMWRQVHGECGPIQPLIEGAHPDGTPWHSSPTQTLPRYYVQNASLEMAWTTAVEVHGRITGRKIAPFFTEGYEGFDLNTLADWREAEYLIASGQAVLPEIHALPA